MARRSDLACRWADVALIGAALNLVVLVVAPILRPDLDLLEKSLSYYAVGPWGAIQALGFVALGVASVALAAALVRLCTMTMWLVITSVMLVVSGVASLGLVWFPMGAPGSATFIGDMHQTAGTIGGVAQLAAALVFALSIRVDPVWAGFIPFVLTTFTISLVGAALTQAAIWWPQLGIPMGASSRLMVLPLVVLWGLVALRLRRTCAEAEPITQSGDAT